MKCLIVLSALLALSVASESNDFWKDFDYQAFENPISLKSTIECVLYEISCQPDDEIFKEHLSEDLKNECWSCSRDEKHAFWEFFYYGEEHYPELLAEFWAKYDPESTLKDQFLENIGISLPRTTFPTYTHPNY